MDCAPRSPRLRRGALASAIRAAVALAAVAAPGHASAGPLAPLSGSWTGQGTITTLAGLEHARCTAEYRVAGSDASLDLRCATESYGLDLVSTVREERGLVAGTWAERRFGTSGTVAGRVEAGRLSLAASVVGAQVSIVIAIAAGRQTVTLRTTSPLLPGGDLVLARSR